MQAIESTACLRRILALPRRSPVPPEGLAEKLTELLRTPKGTMVLRPLQALALHDIGIQKGGFLLLDLGEGKALIALLAAYILDAKRPLLLNPAGLIPQVSREMKEIYRKNFLVPSNVRMLSYQMLGLPQAAVDLEVYQPDLIVADEMHRLKNRDAAVTRRVERYLSAHPETVFVGLTGTVQRKSLNDFAHLLRWALKDNAPVPLRDQEVDEWARCLDEKVENEWERPSPGALLKLATPEEIDEEGEVVAARKGFRRRLRETPGVVCSDLSGADVEAKLVVRALRYDVNPMIEGYYKQLRNDKIAPTGEELWESTEVYRHARELALGFCQRWDPPAPEDWKTARRAWGQYVRGVISRSRTFDSPKHVELAVLNRDLWKKHPYLEAGLKPLEDWKKIEPTFTPNPVPVWHDDAALRVCERWMSKRPGLVWVEHIPFALKLAERTGARYYGEKGFTADKQFVNDADGEESIIVSVDANKEGKNLQHRFHRNLIVSMMSGWDECHQLIGRTHRSLQKTEVVEVDVLLGCAEHHQAWIRANAGARAARDTVGAQSKLLIANTEWPSDDDVKSWGGPQWVR